MEKDNKFYGLNPDESNVDIDDFKCPNCHSTVKFSPEKGTLYCETCGTEVEIEKIFSKEEHSFTEGQIDDSTWNDETKVIECENCGASNVVDNNAISVCCPFCGSNHVIETKELAGVKPHRVIPFKVGNVETVNNYANWLKRRFYAPRKVKKLIPQLEVMGVYLPVWTFDSNTYSYYNGQLGKTYTTTVGSGKNRRTVTKTRYFNIRGTNSLKFDDILINAGGQITQQEIAKIQPFDTNNALIYDQSYLVGFSSEHYKVRLNKGWDEAKVKINARVRSAILSKYTYDTISYLNINTSYNDITYKYVLIPTWVGVYRCRGKVYRFIANGENGKVYGKYPLSIIKILLTVIFAMVVLIALLYYVVTGSGF